MFCLFVEPFSNNPYQKYAPFLLSYSCIIYFFFLSLMTLTEWEHICRQAELLHVKKSSYVRECAKAHYVLMMDQGDMNGIIGAVRGLSSNVNQIARRANKTGRVYEEDITTTKESVNAIWQLLSYIQSATQCADHLNTSWTGIRPEIIRLLSLLCARQNPSEQPNNSELFESVSEVVEAPPKPST